MNNEEIAKELNITRSGVSLIVKRALNKIYNHLRKSNRNLNPFEITVMMTEMFELNTNQDYEKFYRNLPNEIKYEVYCYAPK